MYLVRNGRIFVFLLILVLFFFVWFKRDSEYEVPKHLQKFLMYNEMPVSETIEVDVLKLKIKDINLKRDVRNWKKFGPVRKETVIVIVQVDQNIRGLQYLIISLAQVRYVESILLVFSHSYYCERINKLIRSIDFSKVMQIFYPHSVQLYPHKFPGIDSEDCINGSQSTSQHCQRRDSKLAERKHHWWWKAYFIFDEMEWSPSHTGNVIFLEEDQYVAPDLLHMLKYIHRSLSYFPDVEIMSLGTMYSSNLNPQLLTLEYWRPPFNVGMAFNKTTWNKVVELSSFYCMYDDSSWSYSLLNVFKNFPTGNINMVACVAPRVIAMKQFSNVRNAVVERSHFYSNIGLFPQKVTTVFHFGPNGRVTFDVKASPKGNGGWTNIKDQLLCLEPLTMVAEEYEATTMISRYDLYTD